MTDITVRPEADEGLISVDNSNSYLSGLGQFAI
jgi:hypothetical protein